MPVFQPAANPRFSRASKCTSGKRSRTSASVPSLEPWSTTMVGTPRTLSRHCSIQGSASYVTTATATSGRAASLAMLDAGARAAADALPREDRATRERHDDRHEEEQEPGRERLVCTHAEAPEEAHEERLAYRDPVQREG